MPGTGTRVEGYVRSDGVRVAGYYRGGSGSVERRKDGKIKTNASYKGARGQGEFQQDFNGRVRGSVSEVPLGKMMGIPSPFDDVVGAARFSTEGPGVSAGASLSSALGFAGISRGFDGKIQGELRVDPKAVAGAIADQLNSIKAQTVSAVKTSPELVVNAAQQLNQINQLTRIEQMTPEQRKQALASNILQAAGFGTALTLIPGGPLTAGAAGVATRPMLGAATRPMIAAGRAII